MDEESPLIEHHKKSHPEAEWKMNLELVKYVVKPLQRQVLEGQLIANVPEGTELKNRKEEWKHTPTAIGLLQADRKKHQWRSDNHRRPLHQGVGKHTGKCDLELGRGRVGGDDESDRGGDGHLEHGEGLGGEEAWHSIR